MISLLFCDFRRRIFVRADLVYRQLPREKLTSTCRNYTQEKICNFFYLKNKRKSIFTGVFQVRTHFLIKLFIWRAKNIEGQKLPTTLVPLIDWRFWWMALTPSLNLGDWNEENHQYFSRLNRAEATVTELRPIRFPVWVTMTILCQNEKEWYYLGWEGSYLKFYNNLQAKLSKSQI